MNNLEVNWDSKQIKTLLNNNSSNINCQNIISFEVINSEVLQFDI